MRGLGLPAISIQPFRFGSDSRGRHAGIALQNQEAGVRKCCLGCMSPAYYRNIRHVTENANE